MKPVPGRLHAIQMGTLLTQMAIVISKYSISTHILQ